MTVVKLTQAGSAMDCWRTNTGIQAMTSGVGCGVG